MKTFTQWKTEIQEIEKPLIRSKEWYYSEYGKYCNIQKVSLEVIIDTVRPIIDESVLLDDLIRLGEDSTIWYGIHQRHYGKIKSLIENFDKYHT